MCESCGSQILFNGAGHELSCDLKEAAQEVINQALSREQIEAHVAEDRTARSEMPSLPGE
jgi:hypothetical protein